MGHMQHAGTAAEASLSEADFAAFADLVRRTAGIVLGPSKRELVFGRLSRRLRALGLQTFSQYRALVESGEGEAERGEMINALTTNLTSFFRESHHFDFLADDVLARLLRERTDRRIRLWSAACSSGEEPYSIAMTLHKALVGKGKWDARVLATDIDTEMVRTAQAGIYDADRARAIPAAYASLVARQPDGSVEMTDVLKQRIAFKPLNLLGDWPMQGKFDAVFCRNVVIYFDKDTQRKLFDRLADLIAPGGTLFIGHSETLSGVSDRFENLGRTIYRRLK